LTVWKILYKIGRLWLLNKIVQLGFWILIGKILKPNWKFVRRDFRDWRDLKDLRDLRDGGRDLRDGRRDLRDWERDLRDLRDLKDGSFNFEPGKFEVSLHLL